MQTNYNLWDDYDANTYGKGHPRGVHWRRRRINGRNQTSSQAAVLQSWQVQRRPLTPPHSAWQILNPEYHRLGIGVDIAMPQGLHEVVGVSGMTREETYRRFARGGKEPSHNSERAESATSGTKSTSAASTTTPGLVKRTTDKDRQLARRRSRRAQELEAIADNVEEEPMCVGDCADRVEEPAAQPYAPRGCGQVPVAHGGDFWAKMYFMLNSKISTLSPEVAATMNAMENRLDTRIQTEREARKEGVR